MRFFFLTHSNRIRVELTVSEAGVDQMRDGCSTPHPLSSSPTDAAVAHACCGLEEAEEGGGRTCTMISETEPLPSTPSACPLSSVSPCPEADSHTTSGSIHPLLSSVGGAARIMTSGESVQNPPAAHTPRRALMYKALCFLFLILQGGVLDFYLIIFTDLYWCSWIATDLVVVSGWAIFFIKNARSKRERACGFRQKSPALGCSLGEFTYAYLAWLIYVISCAPKVVLILETSILELITQKVPLGLTGFKAVVLLSAPLLFCLISAVIEDPNGPSRHRSRSCFLGTSLDLLDAFNLVELMLSGEIPTVYLKYAVICVHWLTLAVPVLWLYELNASELGCRRLCMRLLSALLVNAPLLVIRCLLVFVHKAPVCVFLFKNVFFCACQLLELLEECAAVRGSRGPAQFSHCVSDNDMCPHGYVNTLAVAQS